MIVQDVVDAIRKNGLPQAFEIYIRIDGASGNPIAACAIGQAAVNLGRTAHWIALKLDDIYNPKNNEHLDSYIIRLNDTERLSFAAIADKIEKNYAEYLQVTLE